MIYKLTFFTALAIFIMSCDEEGEMEHRLILKELADSTYFNSQNWILFNNSRSGSFEYNTNKSVDIKLFDLEIKTEYQIKDSILYINDEEDNQVTFLDFRQINCNNYKTIHGNSIKLIKFFSSSTDGDIHYIYLLKKPFNVVDQSKIRDRFIIHAALQKGVIGISDYSKDSTTIILSDYKGKFKLMIDSTFNTTCE